MQYIRNKITGEVHQSNSGLWSGEYETMTQKAGKLAYAECAKAKLRSMLKPGDTVYSILRHVSASGMSQRISFVIVTSPDDEGEASLMDITRSVAIATGRNLSNRGIGLVVGGCGMDMGFSVVYGLGKALWPSGTPEPHRHRNGKPDSDGGYALRHEWL